MGGNIQATLRHFPIHPGRCPKESPEEFPQKSLGGSLKKSGRQGPGSFPKQPLVEGSLEVKLPTVWTDEEQRWEESEERREEERRSKRERVRRRKIQVREKVGKSRNCVFPMICGSGGSKSRLAKAAGAEPAGQMRDEQMHAVAARSTFPSQKC